MITLNVSDVCHNCPEFEAAIRRDILRTESFVEETRTTVSTEITCAHELRCRNLMSHLAKHDTNIK